MSLWDPRISKFANLLVNYCIEAKEGDIFNVKTLSKIKRITDGILLVKDVNYYQVYSIARSKTKAVLSSPAGIVLEPIMWPKVPKTQEEIDELKKRIFSRSYPTIFSPIIFIIFI